MSIFIVVCDFGADCVCIRALRVPVLSSSRFIRILCDDEIDVNDHYGTYPPPPRTPPPVARSIFARSKENYEDIESSLDLLYVSLILNRHLNDQYRKRWVTIFKWKMKKWNKSELMQFNTVESLTNSIEWLLWHDVYRWKFQWTFTQRRKKNTSTIAIAIAMIWDLSVLSMEYVPLWLIKKDHITIHFWFLDCGEQKKGRKEINK